MEVNIIEGHHRLSNHGKKKLESASSKVLKFTHSEKNKDNTGCKDDTHPAWIRVHNGKYFVAERKMQITPRQVVFPLQ